MSGGGSFVNRGVEKFLLTYYENIDRQKVQFDFLSARTCENQEMKRIISKLGGRMFELGLNGRGIRERWMFGVELYRLIKEYHYEIVSSSTGSVATMALVMIAAKRAGVRIRIVHSQNTGTNSLKNRAIKAACSPVLSSIPTTYLACSKAAGRFAFPKRVQDRVKVIPNAIDSRLFRYDEDTRNRVRERLGVGQNFVVGHIGAFVPQKNHRFLIDIFSKLQKARPQAVLLLVGSGETQELMKRHAEELGLSQSIIFYGNTDSAHELYQAMDCFVFPSVFEGLGIVAVEAQAAGLKTLCSDVVPPETRVTDLIEYMSVNRPAEEWADKILCYDQGYARRDMVDEIVRAGYDIRGCAKYLEGVYLEEKERTNCSIG